MGHGNGEDLRLGQHNIIHHSVQFGKQCVVGNFCHIEQSVIIGDRVIIGDYVKLKAGTVIGSDCKLDDYVKSSGSNVVEDDVVLRYNVTLARGVHVGRGAYVSPNVMTVYSDHEGRPSQLQLYIGPYAFIGTGAVLAAGVRIEHDAVIGALAYVNCDCEANAVYVGIPAKKIRNNAHS